MLKLYLGILSAEELLGVRPFVNGDEILRLAAVEAEGGRSAGLDEVLLPVEPLPAELAPAERMLDDRRIELPP